MLRDQSVMQLIEEGLQDLHDSLVQLVWQNSCSFFNCFTAEIGNFTVE